MKPLAEDWSLANALKLRASPRGAAINNIFFIIILCCVCDALAVARANCPYCDYWTIDVYFSSTSRAYSPDARIENDLSFNRHMTMRGHRAVSLVFCYFFSEAEGFTAGVSDLSKLSKLSRF
ncbi:hypothetical protein D3C76_1153340 [compost metagenome]